MRVEMIVFTPGQAIGYVGAEEADPVAVRELGIDIAIMGAVDQLRSRLGDRPFRIVFDGDGEFTDTASFISERMSGPKGTFIIRSSEQGTRIREFFGAEEVMVKR